MKAIFTRVTAKKMKEIIDYRPREVYVKFAGQFFLIAPAYLDTALTVDSEGALLFYSGTYYEKNNEARRATRKIYIDEAKF